MNPRLNESTVEEAALSWKLGRRGKFIVLPQRVTTSGRKLRTYSAREILGLFVRAAIGGRRELRKREGLEVWYGERREDTMAPVPPGRGPRTS